MANLRWAEICDHVIVERGGKVGIIGIFNAIGATTFPTEHPDFWVVCKMEGYPNEQIQVEFSLVGPDGEIMASMGPMDGRVSTSGHTYIAGRIFRPRFPTPGRYELRIRPAGNPPTSLFLTLVQRSAEQEQPQQKG